MDNNERNTRKTITISSESPDMKLAIGMITEKVIQLKQLMVPLNHWTINDKLVEMWFNNPTIKKLENIQIASILIILDEILEEVSKKSNIEQVSTESNIEEVSTESNIEQVIQKEKIITYILRDIGIPSHIKGHRYIFEAVLYLIGMKNPETVAMTKELCPYVAKKCATTSSRVERAIRHAIEIARNQNNMLKYIGEWDLLRDKPMNSEFLFGLTTYIKVNYPEIL